jgi:hypothetical protein
MPILSMCYAPSVADILIKVPHGQVIALARNEYAVCQALQAHLPKDVIFVV